MINLKRLHALVLVFSLVTAPSISFAQVAPIEGIGKPLCRYLQANDFTEQASVGQWLLGYYSGALAMNISFSMAQGQSSDVPDRAAIWDEEKLLESARAFCVNHPDQPLYRIANMVVTMVLGD